MTQSRLILPEEHFQLTIDRLCLELIEDYDDFSDAYLVGIQKRGVHLSHRIYTRLREKWGIDPFPHGKMDITFYRDDFRSREKPLEASSTEMKELVEGKKVILCDDVLYTGRTIQSALTAINDFGRPDDVKLLVMVDRRFNRHLPIKSNYTGMTVDALDKAYVRVAWKEVEGTDEILLIK